MKSQHLLIIFLLIFISKGFSQSDYSNFNIKYGMVPSLVPPEFRINDPSQKKSYWRKKNQIGIDLNGVSYENWNAGGTDAISTLINVGIKRLYQKKNIRWNNELISRYGINVQKNKKLEKTEDRLEINSTFGYRTDTISHWFYSAKMNLRTQLGVGYDYPDRSKPISSFMAPGYIFTGFGAEYLKYGDTLALYISPATHKSTWVLNQFLADRGDFGVEPAIKDEEGNIIKPGKRFKSEFGILITNELNFKLIDNIVYHHRLSLYTDYLNNFGNIDIDWDAHLNFKVNDFVRAKLSTALKYDDDTKTYVINEQGEKEERGARVQWMQKLGIGIVVDI